MSSISLERIKVPISSATADKVKTLALIATLSGAAATALMWDPLNIVLLNLGSILYLIWSLKVRDWNLVAVNAGLLTIYGFGAILRIL